MKIKFLDYSKGYKIENCPKPYASKKYIPEWYRNIPNDNYVNVDNKDIGTIKNCIPFLDVMTNGYIISVPETVEIYYQDENQIGISGPGSDLVQTHSKRQTNGSPYGSLATLKFINPWKIVTPKGISCLFTEPLNRPHHLPIRIISGIVDTDNYKTCVHFPASHLPCKPGTRYTIEKGFPLVQVFPFKRINFDSEILEPNEKDVQSRISMAEEKISNPKYYQQKIHVKKSWN